MYHFDNNLAVAREQLIAYTKELHKNPKDTTEQRNNEVEMLTLDYINATGERPNERTLSYLADYILIDLLTSKKKNKPIKTNNQLNRQNLKECQFDEGRM